MINSLCLLFSVYSVYSVVISLFRITSVISVPLGFKWANHKHALSSVFSVYSVVISLFSNHLRDLGVSVFQIPYRILHALNR